MNKTHTTLIKKAEEAFSLEDIQLTTKYLSQIADDFEEENLPQKVIDLTLKCMEHDVKTIAEIHNLNTEEEFKNFINT